MIQVRHHRASSRRVNRPPFASPRRLWFSKSFSPFRTFRISSTECFASGTAAVIPPQPPVPSDGYHSGYSSGNERTAVSAYSFASAADPAWHGQSHGQSHGGIVGHASSGSLGSGTNEPLGGGNGVGGGRVGGPPAAAAAAAAAATAAAGAVERSPDTDIPDLDTLSDRRAATAAAAAAAAYPTAYPVAPVPTPVLAPAPAYDYNVAAYGPMAGSMNAMGGMGANGANPYAGQADPYAMGSDPRALTPPRVRGVLRERASARGARADPRDGLRGPGGHDAVLAAVPRLLQPRISGDARVLLRRRRVRGRRRSVARGALGTLGTSAPRHLRRPSAPPPASDPAPRKASAASSVGKADGDGIPSPPPGPAAAAGDAEDGASATSDVAAPSSGSRGATRSDRGSIEMGGGWG